MERLVCDRLALSGSQSGQPCGKVMKIGMRLIVYATVLLSEIQELRIKVHKSFIFNVLRIKRAQ
jgi:hypothetical protein